MFKPLNAVTRRPRILFLLGLLIIFLVSSFLALQSRAVNPQKVENYQQAISRLRTSEAEFRQNILASRYELFASYDPVVASLRNQQAALEQLKEIPAFIDRRNRKEILTTLNDKEALIEQDEEHSERFKSRNALLKNSLRYLPLLTNQVEKNFNNPSLKERLQPEQITQLRSTLNALIRNLLLYSIASEDDLRTKVETLVQNLSKLNEQYELTSDEFPSQLAISHTNIILNAKPQVERLSAQLLASFSQDSTNNLEQAFKTGQQTAIRTTRIYQVVTGIWFLLLLIATNFFVFRRTNKPRLAQVRNRRHIQKINAVLQALSQPQSAKQLESDSLPREQELAPLEHRRDVIGQLANTAMQLLRQTRSQHQVHTLESFAFLNANLRLLTAQQRALLNEIAPQALIAIFQKTLTDRNCQLLGHELSPEQVFLNFTYPPTVCLAPLIEQLKHNSAVFIVETLGQPPHSNAYETLSPDRVWSQSYLIASQDGQVTKQPPNLTEADLSPPSPIR